MSTLPEYLESAYDVDVEEQLAIHELGTTEAPTMRGRGVETVHRFIVDDLDKANWALRKLARLDAQLKAAEEQARLERERIAGWLASQSVQIDRQRAFFQSLLEHFHRSELHADPSKKTIKLPAGTLKARQLPARVEVADGFVEWAQSSGRDDLIRTRVEPDKLAIKQAVLKDGEVLGAVEVYQGEVRYSVEVTP